MMVKISVQVDSDTDVQVNIDANIDLCRGIKGDDPDLHIESQHPPDIIQRVRSHALRKRGRFQARSYSRRYVGYEMSRNESSHHIAERGRIDVSYHINKREKDGTGPAERTKRSI